MTDEERAKHICDGLDLPREAIPSFVSEFAQVRQAERERLASLGGDVVTLAADLRDVYEPRNYWLAVALFVAALIGAEREKNTALERIARAAWLRFDQGHSESCDAEVYDSSDCDCGHTELGEAFDALRDADPKALAKLTAPSDAPKDAAMDMPKGGEG